MRHLLTSSLSTCIPCLQLFYTPVFCGLNFNYIMFSFLLQTAASPFTLYFNCQAMVHAHSCFFLEIEKKIYVKNYSES